MSDPDSQAEPPPMILARDGGAAIAYHAYRPARRSGPDPNATGTRPGLLFLGGFMSDMTGTKAVALEGYARQRQQAFTRFDYQGHGQSSGAFTDGTIGLWAQDAIAVLDQVTEGPQILIGSSMGGWIMLLTALARPQRIAGLVGIAAAPDFTEDLMWNVYPPDARAQLERDGIYYEPSDYSEEPYAITRRLIEEGRENLLLRDRIPIACPVRLLHGTEDTAVPWDTSLRLMAQLDSDNVEVTLVKGADHRLSEPEDLARLFRTLDAFPSTQ